MSIIRSDQSYDYAIIGAGAAGLHLALAFIEDPYFLNKRILILDPDRKVKNDRTWCFWERGDGRWENVVSYRWGHAQFSSDNTQLNLPLRPYQYKMIKGLDFYRCAIEKIQESENFSWIYEQVKKVELKGEIYTESQKLGAKLIFDSRHTEGVDWFDSGYPSLLQHFKGWWVEVKNDVFDIDSFTMMDYRLKYPETTSFTYVLPISKNQALVEFTFFNREMVQESVYDRYLDRYMREVLGTDDYTITETEKGAIPMTSYPFYEFNSGRHVKIGTAGGWVRPSTGYSFKYAEKIARLITNNLKEGRSVMDGFPNNRFRFYDQVFLDVLSRKNNLGDRLFTTIYSQNATDKVLAFLDGESRLVDEFSIMSKFIGMMDFTRGFLRALLK